MEWINIEDRLPHVRRCYYICFDGRNVGLAWMGEHRFEILIHSSGDGGFVTHWMVLPEPPSQRPKNPFLDEIPECGYKE